MRRRAILLLLLVGCAGLGAAAWWFWPRRPNVILITVDALRADRLSCYGYEKHQTPNFDRLAREGVLFENAFCDVTWTTPSMASVMTGRYATRHGVQSSFQRLSPGARTLAAVLHGQGITTAAIIGSFPLDSVFGLDQGFLLYDDTFSAPLAYPEGFEKVRETHPAKTPVPSRFSDDLSEMGRLIVNKAAHDAYRPDNELSDRAIAWLREERKEPFFLRLHYLGPHEKPQRAHDFAEQLLLQIEQYDPDVVNADQQVGRVLTTLDELQLTDHTAVILHADHGQSLNEHNCFGHGRFLYDDTQHIPLLMRLSGRLPAGKRVARMVRNVDIFPTVLDLFRVPFDGPLDGHSLLPVINGMDDDYPEETYVETYLSGLRTFADVLDRATDTRLGLRRLGIRTRRWKFIINDPIAFVDMEHPPPLAEELHRRHYSAELYDLATDPGEITNVIASNRQTAALYWKRVVEYHSGVGMLRASRCRSTRGPASACAVWDTEWTDLSVRRTTTRSDVSTPALATAPV